ncbi:MAG: hypothetical protein ACON5A_02355 [Candidatus Comchoanobacterales bacterium]
MVAKKDTHNDCCQQHCCSMMKRGLKIAVAGLLFVGIGHADDHLSNEKLTVTSIMNQEFNSYI